MYEATVIETFCAAHYLPNHPGKCANMHGHTWKVEMTVKGRDVGSETGILADFHDLKIMLRLFLERLDHTILNDALPDLIPTAECLAKWLFAELYAGFIDCPVFLKNIRVWESDTAFVDYYG